MNSGNALRIPTFLSQKRKKRKGPIFMTKIYVNKTKITLFKHGCGQIDLPYFFLTTEGEKHGLELLIKHGR